MNAAPASGQGVVDAALVLYRHLTGAKAKAAVTRLAALTPTEPGPETSPTWMDLAGAVTAAVSAHALGAVHAHQVLRTLPTPAPTATAADAARRAGVQALLDEATALHTQAQNTVDQPVTVLDNLLGPEQEASWAALIQMANRLPAGGTLVGGQMVVLHCAERAAAPQRPTNDGDAILDVSAHPGMLLTFTTHLAELDFHALPGSPDDNHQHRWVRDSDKAQVDLLIPEHTGQRIALQAGVTGSTTLATPGGADALSRTRYVPVTLRGVNALIPRPDLIGALVAKGRAALNRRDNAAARHHVDAAILMGLIERRDRDDLTVALADRRHRGTLTALQQVMAAEPLTWQDHADFARRGWDVLARALANG